MSAAMARKASALARGTNVFPNRITLGIDEAGRGPAIGPMVMAAVAIDSRTAALLSRKGLRDSKTYGAGDDAHAIRSELAAEIRTREIRRDDRGRAHRDRRTRHAQRAQHARARARDQADRA